MKSAPHKTAANAQKITNNPQVGVSKADLKCKAVLGTPQMLMCYLNCMKVHVQHC